MFDEYTSLEDCEKKLEKFENTEWVEKERKTTKAGFKQWYKCKFYDKRAYILFHRQNMSVSLYVEECAHKEHQRNDFFIDKKTKQKVLDLSVNYKTKYIGQWLRDNINEGYDELNDSQISNILSRKNNTEHSSKITLADLQKWCDQKKNVPQDPDEMFSAEFDFNLETGVFHLFVTSKRLLLTATFFIHLCADTTYKIMWQGFPLLVVGKTDKSKQFHPFGVMISKNEDNHDFEFMFDQLKKLLKAVHNFDYKPTVLIADAAEAITIGFEAVFELEARVVCWAHVIRAVDARLISIKDVPTRKLIRADIFMVQGEATNETFDAAITLLKEKWLTGQLNQQVIDFLDYFEFWLADKKRGWYEGLTRGLPSHDNALEGTNAWIKKITLRDLLSVSQFLNILETKIIGPWSKESNTIDFNTTKEIHMFPPIETALWKNAYKYHQEQRRLIKFKLDGINYQCVGCQNETANKAKADAFVSKTKSLEFENFNDYIDVMRSVRWVNLNGQRIRGDKSNLKLID